MIKGKYSALKGFFLGVLIALAMLDVIFTVENSIFVKTVNCIVTVGGIAALVAYLWNKWKVRH